MERNVKLYFAAKENTMYFLYVDESGDIGLLNSPTKYFCLSGLVVHELRWEATLSEIVGFRRYLKGRYGLKLREEIHTADFMFHPGDLKRIGKSIRLHILKEAIEFQATIPDISVINVVVDKSNKQPGTDIFEMAWQTLIQRFHNTLSYRNFPGPQNSDERGLLITDNTDEPKLRRLSRKMGSVKFLSQIDSAPQSWSLGGQRLEFVTF